MCLLPNSGSPGCEDEEFNGTVHGEEQEHGCETHGCGIVCAHGVVATIGLEAQAHVRRVQLACDGQGDCPNAVISCSEAAILVSTLVAPRAEW